MMILVSAGHHPYRKGASYKNWYEYDEAKIWASLISNKLGQYGMVVPPGLLPEKVDFVNSQSPDLAVEIHFNAAMKDGVNVGEGSETLYCPGSMKGRRAAAIVQESVSQIFRPNRGTKEGWYKMDRNKGPDYFLAKTRCPALIVEPEFIQHKEKIQDNRDAACAAIAQALTDVLGELS